MDRPRYSIGELAELTGVSRRTVHFYVQRRLIDPPLGRGRGRHYDDRHATQILRVRELQRLGVPLSGMAESALPAAALLETRPAGGPVTPVARIHVGPNVTVDVAHGAASITPELVADLASAVGAVMSRHRGLGRSGGAAETAASIPTDSDHRPPSPHPAADPSPGWSTHLRTDPQEEQS